MREQALLVFILDQQRYALPLANVLRVVRAVAVTKLPQTPKIVLGIINVAGTAIPVIDLRVRFNHPSRAIRLEDHFLIADTGKRTVALLVDAAKIVIEQPARPCSEVIPGLDYISGVVELEDGIILIHDLNQLLSCEEETAIESAMQELATEDKSCPAS